MKNKIKIELDEKTFNLIERAMDLYSRVGILQFNYLTDCNSLQELVWKKGAMREFEDKALELKEILGYNRNANPGILNTIDVGDDVRIAANIHQQMRHYRYIKNEDINKPKYTVNAYPADVCKLAGIEEPEFYIK